MAFEHELRVRYGECDAQGIVFNAHYLSYFDVAYTELWRAAVGSWSTLTDAGLDSVVGEARLRFRAPARFDDLVTIELTPVLGRSSVTTAVRYMRAGELLADGELRHVIVSTDTWTPVEIPDWVRDGLEAFR